MLRRLPPPRLGRDVIVFPLDVDQVIRCQYLRGQLGHCVLPVNYVRDSDIEKVAFPSRIPHRLQRLSLSFPN
jgi:hypothetical protein